MKPPIRGRTEPPAGLLRRMDAILRSAFPSLVTLGLIVLAAVPVGAPGLVMAVCLPSVFFWTIFRPSTMPPPAVFCIGLAHDLLTLAPLGTGVLVLLLAHGITVRFRGLLVRQSFWLVWLAYGGVAVGGAAMVSALTGLLNWQLPPTTPAMHQLGISVGLYPMLAWVLTRAHRAMQNAEA
jgi:rod shape-determining protein MreD